MKELWISTKNKELEKDAKFNLNATLVKGEKAITPQNEEFQITKDEKKVNKKTIFEIAIRDKEDEKRAVKVGIKSKAIIVQCSNWKIIPLENLIASLGGKTKILAKVKSAKEAKVALETLELGVEGIVLETNEIKEFEGLKKILKEFESSKIILEEASITNIKPLGLGARACLDTCELMTQGEGMLIGSSSQGMFLVQAEVEQTPFVSPRPFRVNAGAVSLYALTPNNKTKYLEEIKSGDEILIVTKEGKTRTNFICRSKIEIRPLILIETESRKKFAKIILQNAETVRLMTKNGSKEVTALEEGDKVLVHFEKGGRHFGTLVKEEQIIEK